MSTFYAHFDSKDDLLVSGFEDVREALPGAAQASVPSEALVQFIAGALFGVLTWWLDARTRLPVAEVDALFRRLAIPALKAAPGERL